MLPGPAVRGTRRDAHVPRRVWDAYGDGHTPSASNMPPIRLRPRMVSRLRRQIKDEKPQSPNALYLERVFSSLILHVSVRMPYGVSPRLIARLCKMADVRQRAFQALLLGNCRRSRTARIAANGGPARGFHGSQQGPGPPFSSFRTHLNREIKCNSIQVPYALYYTCGFLPLAATACPVLT